MTWSARSYPRTSCIGPGPRPSFGSCPTPGIRLGNRGFSARWSTPPNASSARLRSPADWRKTNKNAAASRGVFLFPERVSDTQYLHRFRERVDRFLVLAGLVQRFAIGAELLDFGHLLRRQLRVLFQRRVDLLHVRRAVKGERGGADEHERAEQCCKTNLHEFSLKGSDPRAAHASRLPALRRKRRHRQIYSGLR